MLAMTTAGAVAGTLAGTPAAAQDGPQDGGGYTLLGRIVLGFGLPRVAIDTPAAVTVVNQEDLDREQANTLSDLFATVPGVQTAGSPRFSGQAFNIRGIGNTEQTASEARIIVTVDGAPKFFEQYRMGSFFGDLELYKQVEVLRGPASSTLYGSGAIGGVINFTTKDASDFLQDDATRALRLKTGYESNGDVLLGSVIYATRPSENAEFLAALNYGTGNDIEDGDGTEIEGSAYDRVSGLLKGTWTFGDDLDQSVRLSFSRTEGTLEDSVVAQTGGPAVAGFGTSDIETTDSTVILGYAHAGAGNPWLDLDVTLSFTETEVDKSDFSLGAFCAPGTLQVLCDNDATYRTVALKAENTIEFGGGAWENYLTFGAQLSHQDRLASSSLGALAFHPEGEDTKLALYAQGEFTWNDRLTLIPGLRVEYGERTPSAETEAEGATAQTDVAVSPKLAVMYELSDTWSVFGSLARTERMPTLDELYSTDAGGPPPGGGPALPARLPSLNLDKETATTVELGLAYDGGDVFRPGDSLQVKATAFHNDIDDLIGTTPRVPGGPAVPYFSNIAEARIWGAEIEGAYETERFFGRLAYANIRSEDRATGATLPDTPAESLALTLGHRFPDRGLEVSWRGNWFDDIETSSATTTAAAYNTHDLFLTWRPEAGVLDGFEVNFAVENVFDTTYRNNLSQDNGPGRTFKLTLARAFDW